ncbi:FAD-dependent oxidoreductase [Solwaraspora sp. WMMD791]|uniref:NAD(P)/FAD-dependent oxidoreductase n=1 Tax=Solwaraspora sp. WMMD791 TaxID=3016086 RepID=UPI00249C7FE0|nr:FAD-dependent monooxygenase [Solwaraspora sp. WMMD791]WFE28045.1 FAD-dependent oxidoreductase [Solwaraspora sp. WMMD791]
MSQSTVAARHAVVIGGSLAGLCAARALVDHVDRVTVVDRDRFPDGPTVRAGVPQAHHLHVLVTAGQQALDQLFPGLLDELRRAGAVEVANPTDILYLSATGWRDRFPPTHRLVGISRERLDWTVRGRLVADTRVRFLPGHEVVGLLGAADRDAVTGVELRRRGTGGTPRQGGTGDEVQRLDADLVIDASGRSSHTPRWLDRLGYGRPQEITVESGLGYASRRYVLAPRVAAGWKNIVLMPQPPTTGRGGVIYPIENDRWMVTLGGLGGDCPPTDEAGFLEFARGLRSPVLYEAIKDATPDSPIHGFRDTGNRRRRYEAMPRWPDGFAVVGDAACTFNPVYGQGMSVAAQAGVTLAAQLQTTGGRLDRAAQVKVAAGSEAAWLIATGADLRYPTTVGDQPARGGRLSRWYLDRAADVANRDPYVLKALTDVFHLVAPLSAVARPGVALRVLRGRPGPRLDTPPSATVAG